MNEELLAASALLVQSGAWLVCVNIKSAYSLQTVTTLVFGLRYAAVTCNCPMLSQLKSAMAAPQRELETLIQLLKKKADRLLEQKLTGNQFKNSKTIRDTYLGQDLSIHVKPSSIHLVTKSL